MRRGGRHGGGRERAADVRSTRGHLDPLAWALARLREYMIIDGAGPVEVELRGIERARPSEAALAAIAEAEAIVIGPSNPIISIGPIWRSPGCARRFAGLQAVVAVSPFVGGRAVKGPTDRLRARRHRGERGQHRPRLRRRARRRRCGRLGGWSALARARHADADG